MMNDIRVLGVVFCLLVLATAVVHRSARAGLPVQAGVGDGLGMHGEAFPYHIGSHDIAVYGDYVWWVNAVNSSAVVVRWHKQTQTYTVFTAEDGLFDDAGVRDIAVDDEGHVWLSVLGHGVNYFDGTQWSSFAEGNQLTNNRVSAIEVDAQGKVWIGTDSALDIYDHGNWSYLPFTEVNDPDGCGEGHIAGNVVDIAFDTITRIWIATNNGPVCYYDGSEWVMVFVEGSSVSSTDIEVAANGDIWFAGFENSAVGDGVARLTMAGDWTVFDSGTGLFGDETVAVAEDMYGNMWVLVDEFGDRGLNMFDGSNWYDFREVDGYEGGFAEMVFADDGVMWTAGPTSYHEGDGRWRRVYMGYTDRPREMMIDRRGNLWAYSYTNYGEVLFRFDGGRWHYFSAADGFDCLSIVNVVAGLDDEIWVACADGQVLHFDGMDWQRTIPQEQLSGGEIEMMSVDEGGQVWIGYRINHSLPSKEGVARWDGVSVTNYTMDDGLLADYVAWVYSQGDEVWVSYDDGAMGVSVFNGSGWSTVPGTEGLNVWQFVVDQLGRLIVLEQSGNSYDVYVVENGAVEMYSPPNRQYGGVVGVDQFNNVWFVDEDRMLLFSDGVWRLLDQDLYGTGVISGKAAINGAGDMVWGATDAGLVKLDLWPVATELFLPVVRR